MNQIRSEPLKLLTNILQTGLPKSFRALTKAHKNYKITKSPSAKQLNILRDEVDPLNIRKLEFTNGEDRINLLEEILNKEKKMIKQINLKEL